MNARLLRLSTLALVCAATALLEPAAAGGDVAGDDVVVRALPAAKHSLLEAVRAAAKSPSVAISAKFEDEGKGLSLSVYTARSGLDVEAEANVLQELAGDPAALEWKPSTEVFQDVVHVARASAQLTLMRTTKLSLDAAILSAESRLRPFHDATVFSITPAVQDGKGVFLVGVAVADVAYHIVLDLQNGTGLAPWPKMPKRPLPTPLVGKVLSEPVTGQGTWIGSTPSSLAETVGKRVVLVVSNSYG